MVSARAPRPDSRRICPASEFMAGTLAGPARRHLPHCAHTARSAGRTAATRARAVGAFPLHATRQLSLPEVRAGEQVLQLTRLAAPVLLRRDDLRAQLR